VFSGSAEYYDIIYAARGKDYEREAGEVAAIAREHQRAAGQMLLDVGCGTGGHLVHLSLKFQAEGLDLDDGLLEVARRKLPGIPLHKGDMLDFDLRRRFDVVVCLFGSIGYVRSVERLKAAVRNLHRHLSPGGVLIVEPWLSPSTYQLGKAHATFVDEPDLKIARLNASQVVDGNVSVLDFHYLVATPAGVQHFTEHHELGLFTHEQYVAAFEACAMEVRHDDKGLDGRGLYVGIGRD
jgi:SAM-dependent methyltransferase